PGPRRMGMRAVAALALERADAIDAQRKARPFDLRQLPGEVVRGRRLDLADEAQREVKLLGVLPARALDPFHRIGQRIADRLGRADADEQAVGHGRILARIGWARPRRDGPWWRAQWPSTLRSAVGGSSAFLRSRHPSAISATPA